MQDIQFIGGQPNGMMIWVGYMFQQSIIFLSALSWMWFIWNNWTYFAFTKQNREKSRIALSIRQLEEDPLLEGRPSARRLPLEWGSGEGVTEASLKPRKYAGRLLRTQDLVLGGWASHQLHQACPSFHTHVVKQFFCWPSIFVWIFQINFWKWYCYS